MTASELKARLLAVLDDVERTGEVVVVTKRGREVARLVGPVVSACEFPQQELRGSVRFLGDIVEPIFPEEAWEALSGAGLVAEPALDLPVSGEPAPKKPRRGPRRSS